MLQQLPARGPAAGRAQQEARASAALEDRGREGDARALLELATSLDVKEALLRQLRDFNDMASTGGLDKSGPLMQQSYAQLLLHLKVRHALQCCCSLCWRMPEHSWVHAVGVVPLDIGLVYLPMAMAKEGSGRQVMQAA